MNDFECAAYGLNCLHQEDLICLRQGTAKEGTVKVMIGVGTGLGTAFATGVDGIYKPFASESGWLHFWEISDFDREIAAYMRRLNGSNVVSFEDVCSGPSLVKLYEYIASMDGSQPMFQSPRDICANYDSNEEARRAVHLILGYLGRFICQISLVYKPTGGVYLTGGMMDSLYPLVGRSHAFVEGLNSQTDAILLAIARSPSISYICRGDVGILGARECAIFIRNSQLS